MQVDPGVLLVQVRLMFLRGACSYGFTPSEEVVEAKINKILTADTKSTLNYAFVAGRNWAISERLRQERAAKRAILNEQRAAQEAREAAHEQDMKDEMDHLIWQVFSDPARKPGQWGREQLALILIRDNVQTSKWAEFFDGLTVVNLHQIRCRTIKFVKQRYKLSDELVKWIEDRKRKHK